MLSVPQRHVHHVQREIAAIVVIEVVTDVIAVIADHVPEKINQPSPDLSGLFLSLLHE